MNMKRILLGLAALLLIPAAYPADVKISALPAGTTLAGTEPIPAVQSAATVRTTPAAIALYTLGNAFTQFTGPATSAKTFTLPNASSTILTSNALVSVAQGGTGVGTLTGPIKGNGTSAFSAAASADIIGLWSGSCSASTVLLGSGACGASPGLPVGANPTAVVGATAVNGSAVTFMRSDAAPALDLSLTATYTGVPTWSLTEPRLLLNQSGAGADLKLWDIDVASGVLTMRTRTDVDGAGKNWLAVTRGTTTAVSDLSFGNATDNPTYTFLGTNTVQVNGAINVTSTSGALRFSTNAVTGTPPGNGMYLSATNTLNFATASTSRMTIGSGGEVGAAIGIKVTNATTPYLTLNTSGQSANARAWAMQGTGATLEFAAQDDVGGTLRDYMLATRSGAAISSLNFGNATDNPTYTFLGTSTASFNPAVNVFGSSLTISRADPREYFAETDQGSDLKTWLINPVAGVLTFSTVTDALGAGKTYMAITRGVTTAISNVSLGNATDNPTFTWAGTGGATFGGGLNVGSNSVIGGGRVDLTGSTVPGNGIYRPAASTLGFASNATARATFDAAGNFNVNSGIVSAGTKFTTSGCSVSATTGGATAGVFTLGANTCNVVITLGGATGSTAPNGWACDANDRTAPTILIGGESSSTTTTATIAIPAGAGATDVISFSCVGF